MELLSIVIWPAVVLMVAFLFRQQIGTLLNRITRIKATSKGVELLIEKLEQQHQLSFGSRAELSGLSSHDIWALADFATKKIPTIVSRMGSAQRVAARSLKDAGLLQLRDAGEKTEVVVTELGRKILEAAGSLTL